VGRKAPDSVLRDETPAVFVSLNVADVVVPEGASEQHVALVLRAVADLWTVS